MIHELHRPSHLQRPMKQIGRWNGSGKWNYSTKWLKGQKARTWFSQQPWFEWGQTPLHMRLPKKRWFTRHYTLTKKVSIVNIDTLTADERISSWDTISLMTLYTLWYLALWHSAKILGRWECTKKIIITNEIQVSASALASIQAVWWSIVSVQDVLSENSSEEE
jgi:large subunit ribosomal protein L15